MIYRKLGRTGLNVGEIALGCEGFVQKPELAQQFLDAAEQAGANYIDLYTSDPAARTALGKALAGRREQFILPAHLCSVWKDGQYQRTRDLAEVRQGFAALLEELR